MEIDTIEDIESELPLYVIKDGLANVFPTTKERKTNKTMVQIETTIIQDSFLEGGIEEVYSESKRQKRNPKLREEAIRVYGYNCMVCGFSFEDTYGDFGTGYIEVHHLELLSAIKDERLVNINEVSVVCANCHRVLHRNGKELMPLEELKKRVEQIRKFQINK